MLDKIAVTYYLQLLFTDAEGRDSAYGRIGVVKEWTDVEVLYQQKGKHATGKKTSGLLKSSQEELPTIELVVEVSQKTRMDDVVSGLIGDPRLSEKRAVTEANLSMRLISSYKAPLELFQSELEAVCSQQGFDFERVKPTASKGAYFFNLLVIGDVRPVLYVHSFIQGRAGNREVSYGAPNLIFV